MFKERKTKLTLLSLLSALVVISTASMGMIYAQEVDDSELTTFEEEALKAEEEITATADANDTSAYLSGQRVDDSADDTETASETETADLDSLFAGLIVCDLGPVDASAPDETAIASSEALPTPTVSVTVMSETEVAEAVANETTTASANETQIASAECMNLGGDDDNATSTSSTADDMSNATSDAGDNATSTASNATSTDGNATSTDSANATSASTATSTAGNEEIAVIEGQDFAPGEVVLVFSSNAIVAIDDVDESGDIEAKVPMSNVGNDISFVETGTQRSTEFNFDGQTLIAAEGQGEIQAEGTNQELDIAEILRNGTNAAEIEGQDANATDDSN